MLLFRTVYHLTYFSVPIGCFSVNLFFSTTTHHLSWTLRLKLPRHYPTLTVGSQSKLVSPSSYSSSRLASPLVTINLAQPIAASQPEARDALSSMLRGCCKNPASYNNLFVDHSIESCCDTDEEQRDAVLRHLLNGMCFMARCSLV